jgi:hypothetical protein
MHQFGAAGEASCSLLVTLSLMRWCEFYAAQLDVPML